MGWTTSTELVGSTADSAEEILFRMYELGMTPGTNDSLTSSL